MQTRHGLSGFPGALYPRTIQERSSKSDIKLTNVKLSFLLRRSNAHNIKLAVLTVFACTVSTLAAFTMSNGHHHRFLKPRHRPDRNSGRAFSTTHRLYARLASPGSADEKRAAPLPKATIVTWATGISGTWERSCLSSRRAGCVPSSAPARLPHDPTSRPISPVTCLPHPKETVTVSTALYLASGSGPGPSEALSEHLLNKYAFTCLSLHVTRC